MVLIETSNLHGYLNETKNYQGNFQTVSNQKKSKAADYLDSLYSYPPKIKIKWDTLDEFTNDLLIEENYGVLEHSFPFIDFIEDWFFNSNPQELVSGSYTREQYLDGYLDKVNSTNFYNKKTRTLQEALREVPVFVIINGNGEIVLNKPSNDVTPKSVKTILNEKAYDFCGAFDSNVEARQQLGFFFLSRIDAEAYLKAVAQSDIDGTQTVGLSINCIGLDSAYKVTREYHPGTDFRFVPNLAEIQNFLSKKGTKSSLIVENEQQQLRFRPRVANLLPVLEKIGARLSQGVGARSFIQTNEYFKGVPIYIVQVMDNPRNLLFEQYFSAIGILDTAWGKFTQPINHMVGMGDNVFSQGTLPDTGKNVTNYIFFDKKQATKFVKVQGRKVTRYRGANVSSLESFIRKSKIFVYNLEDFIESWEDHINSEINNTEEIQTIYQAKKTLFVSPAKETMEMLDFQKNYKEKPFQNISQALSLKMRVLKRNVGIFLSAN